VQWIKRTAINSFLNSLETEDVQWCGSAAWEYRLISAGISFVQTQTVGEFIPQMFNLDYLGGISFTKGCYTGQEIIARMKYRGKVKRRCYPFITTAANNTLVIGDECLNAEGQLIGTVVSVANDIKNISAQSYGMVAIKVAAAEESSLSIKGETTITITALPYAVDSDDE
jgi:folate-binding protein YgfZ